MSRGQGSGGTGLQLPRRLLIFPPAQLSSAARAVGAWDTPPPCLTNPSCLCSPHLPVGVGLDPGIWGKGHLGLEGEMRGGEKVPVTRDSSSCPSNPPALFLAQGQRAGAPAQPLAQPVMLQLRAWAQGNCPGRLLASVCPGNSATAPIPPLPLCVTPPFLASTSVFDLAATVCAPIVRGSREVGG